jgi:hypothetical protein
VTSASSTRPTLVEKARTGRGCDLAEIQRQLDADPGSLLASSENRLLDGELERAPAWATELAGRLAVA